MTQFLARLFFSIQIEDYSGPEQFDEQFRLILAENRTMAIQLGQTLGHQLQEQFVNADGKLVSWNFIEHVEVFSLDENRSNSLIFSQHHEIENPVPFLLFQKERAQQTGDASWNQ